MPVLFTAIITTNDWKALRERNRAILVVQAQWAGAIRYRIYRNVHDASQVLMIAEFPDDQTAAAFSMRAAGAGHLKALKTTPLLTLEEGLGAMGRSGSLDYPVPG